MRVLTAAVSAVLLGLVSAKTRTVTKESGQTIQQTIDAAHPGDRIVVEKGTYQEQLTISKNGISLIGHDATLEPPSDAVNNTCSGLAGPTVEDPTILSQAGICITGINVHLDDFPGFEHRKFQSVDHTVKEVSVSGFTLNGFSGIGIAVVGARDTTVSGNTLIDHNYYGALAVGSTNTVFKHNTVHSAPLPYPYIRVIGICMDDKKSVSVHDNEISEYWIGLCVQTNGANVYKNKVYNSCIGAYVDPTIDGAKVHDNEITGTGGNCSPDNPIFGAAGVFGIAMFGAVNTVVKGNTIVHPHGDGIAIMDDFSGAIASGNLVEKNNVSGPNPAADEFDIHVDTKGTGNVVKKNVCASSIPAGLCK